MEGNNNNYLNFRVALLQPVAGGHVTITNQSGKMVQLMDSSNPVHRVLGTLTLYRYGVKIVIFNDGRDFRSFRWSCDTRLTSEKVWQQ